MAPEFTFVLMQTLGESDGSSDNPSLTWKVPVPAIVHIDRVNTFGEWRLSVSLHLRHSNTFLNDFLKNSLEKHKGYDLGEKGEKSG